MSVTAGKLWAFCGQRSGYIYRLDGFATTHPKQLRERLLADGVPESRLKPFNIMHRG
jgi:hypothetical protein